MTNIRWKINWKLKSKLYFMRTNIKKQFFRDLFKWYKQHLIGFFFLNITKKILLYKYKIDVFFQVKRYF